MEEVFTYIDKIIADRAEFMKFLDEEELARKHAANQMVEIKRHPWFQEFCTAVGAAAELWGKEEGDPVEEVRLFQEWLTMAEQDQAFHGPCMHVQLCMCLWVMWYRCGHAGDPGRAA